MAHIICMKLLKAVPLHSSSYGHNYLGLIMELEGLAPYWHEVTSKNLT